MNKVKLRKPPTAVLIAIIAVVALVGATVAWLIVDNAVMNRSYSLSNFDAYADVYFWHNDERVTPSQGSDKSILVEVNNETAQNYIGKLRVDAYYKGRGQFYMRLKIIQQWSDGTKILQSNAVLPYEILNLYSGSGNQNAWFDNRLDDFCLYYANKVAVTNESYVLSSVITGVNTAEFDAIKPNGATLKIAITLEAVQVNRYPQFWDLETLPWLG